MACSAIAVDADHRAFDHMAGTSDHLFVVFKELLRHSSRALLHRAHLAGILFANAAIQALDANRGMHLGHILAVVNRGPLGKRNAEAEGPDGGFHAFA